VSARLRSFFIDGLRSANFRYSYLNATFVERIQHFCRDNLRELREGLKAAEKPKPLFRVSITNRETSRPRISVIAPPFVHDFCEGPHSAMGCVQ
jgi:hypothetical protein